VHPKKTKNRHTGAYLKSKQNFGTTHKKPLEPQKLQRMPRGAKAAKAAKGAKKARDEDEDDVPIVELVRRGEYLDPKWRAPGRGKVLEIKKIVDWKIENKEIFFLVWWEGHSLRESTWEPAAGIHPVQQRVFFQAAGVLD
jgi:hypothetical protein